MRTQPTRGFQRLVLALLAYTLIIIAWGAFVRFSGSGDGCGKHWPLCQGYFLPGGPESQTLQTWIEFIHRAKSGLLGLLILFLGFWAYRLFPRGHWARRSAWAAVFFMITEALLGAWLVLAGLVDENSSNLRIFAVALHSVNTLFLLASLTLTFAWSQFKTPSISKTSALNFGFGFAAVAGFIVLAITGALASLGHTLFPSESLSEGLREDFHSESHWIIRLRIIHPFLAVIVGALLINLGLRLPKGRSFLITMVCSALVIGAATLFSLSPTSLRILHLVVVDILWISLCLGIVRAWTFEKS